MAVVIVVALVVLVAAVLLLARRGASRTGARIESRLAGLAVERQSKATFFGLASAGATPVRALGVLALTPDELVFFQFVPDREVRVPRAAISSVTTSTSFLDRSSERDLLVVAWDGQPTDTGAWEVDDVPAWRASLETGLAG